MNLMQPITEFYRDYLRRLEEVDAIEQGLLTANTKRSWTQHLVRKSASIRESYSVVAEKLQQIILPFITGEKEPTMEEAEALREGAMLFFYKSIFDEVMVSAVLDMLARFYAGKGNRYYERMCRFAFANNVYLGLEGSFSEKSLEEAERVFANISDIRVIAKEHKSQDSLLQDVNFILETGFRLFDRECRRFSPDTDRIVHRYVALASMEQYADVLPKAFYADLCEQINDVAGVFSMFMQARHWDDVPQKRKEYLSSVFDSVFAKEAELPEEKRDPIYYMAYVLYAFYAGKYSPDECFNMLYPYTKGLSSDINFSEGDWYSFNGSNRFFAICTTTRAVLQMVCKSRLSESQKKQKVAEILYDVIEFIQKIPRECASRENMDHCLYHLLYDVIEFIDDESMAIEFIDILMMNRQLSTLIHTIMTAKLTQAIMDPLIDQHPEWFYTCLSVSNDEEVLARKEELALFVYNAARCHDIGKIRIGSIVNTQIRKISEEEYGLIKKHPEWSYEVLLRNKKLAPYAEIALGHHKSYDDAAGYPMEFSIAGSKYRILIDILKICDCIDAATDFFGRNYTRGKNFEKVFAEFEEVKGTRYNPDIIDFIKQNEKLFAQLKEITSKDAREDFYYHIYRKYR